MADMSYVSNGNVHTPESTQSSNNGAPHPVAPRVPAPLPGLYVAVSPKGVQLPIPKELFVALSDFIATRKCAGSITIQFRNGEILCVESVAKKTYRNNV